MKFLRDVVTSLKVYPEVIDATAQHLRGDTYQINVFLRDKANPDHIAKALQKSIPRGAQIDLKMTLYSILESFEVGTERGDDPLTGV